MAYSPGQFIRYCLTCSRNRLGNLLLSRMNTDANLRKELAEKIAPLLDKIIDNGVELRWISQIRDHGEEIMSALTEKSDEPQSTPLKAERPASLSRASGED